MKYEFEYSYFRNDKLNHKIGNIKHMLCHGINMTAFLYKHNYILKKTTHNKKTARFDQCLNC